jgi:hypothetical protein
MPGRNLIPTAKNQTGLRQYLDFWATIQSVTLVSVSPRDAGKFTRKMAVPVMLDAFREADARMCRTIGVTRERGAAAMYRLWGRPFSDERDARTEPGANAQRKGQISRQLKAELEEAIG